MENWRNEGMMMCSMRPASALVYFSTHEAYFKGRLASITTKKIHQGKEEVFMNLLSKQNYVINNISSLNKKR